MKKKILIPEDSFGLKSEWRAWLLGLGYEIVSGSGSIEPAYLKGLVRDADAILARAAAQYTPEIIDAAEKLRIIARFGVGYDNVDVPHCTRRGVYVSITPEANYGAVAEHAVGLMIACAHRFLPLHAAGAKGDWAIRNTLATNTLFGKTVGILGLGRIGRKVAMICEKGLDMKVLGYDPMVSAVPGLDTLEMAGSMQEIFTRADVVTLHMPYTPDSHALVNRDVLRGMKDSAILINTARGSLVDENALYEALRDGEIAGAGLDVRMTEPPVGISPLFDCANCIITPHSSALGEEVKDLMGLHAAQEVHRVLSGEKPIWARNTF